MNLPDAELIARVLADDDRAAFAALIHRHQSAVRGFLRQLTRGDHALADDLSQETFIWAYRGLARFRGDARFPTWLLGIAHNSFRNERRRQQRRAAAPPDESADVDLPPSATADLKLDLDAALTQLVSAERAALHLHYRHGLSPPAIPALLHLPPDTGRPSWRDRV